MKSGIITCNILKATSYQVWGLLKLRVIILYFALYLACQQRLIFFLVVDKLNLKADCDIDLLVIRKSWPTHASCIPKSDPVTLVICLSFVKDDKTIVKTYILDSLLFSSIMDIVDLDIKIPLNATVVEFPPFVWFDADESGFNVLLFGIIARIPTSQDIPYDSSYHILHGTLIMVHTKHVVSHVYHLFVI